MAFPDEQREKLVEWLDVIKEDVQGLVIHNHMFWEVQDIIRQNERLAQSRNHFYEWLGHMFINSTVVGMRRQIDRDTDSISLLRLLTRLKDNPKILPRSYHLGLYPTDEGSLRLADRTFTKFAGKGDVLDSSIAQTDIDRLLAKTEKLHLFANREITHRDARGFPEGASERPRFIELTEAIQLSEELTRKYLILLQGAAPNPFLPYFQYDWKEIFRFAWIEPADSDNLDGP